MTHKLNPRSRIYLAFEKKDDQRVATRARYFSSKQAAGAFMTSIANEHAANGARLFSLDIGLPEQYIVQYDDGTEYTIFYDVFPAFALIDNATKGSRSRRELIERLNADWLD